MIIHSTFIMGKKRAREAEGKEVPPADTNVDKMDEDGSDDEVWRKQGSVSQVG